jgi:ubiquinone/menaquinone biosynthesis C-methylase UbiE
MALGKEDWLKINKSHHDGFANEYEGHHAEIYNAIEQDRLFSVLQEVVQTIRKNTLAPHVLDFGTGAGNLTSHFLNLGCHVTATDVSEGCLDQVKLSFHENGDRLQTVLLNGQDLTNFEDDFFDICATYSVLHHVPDYLLAVRELARVTKPGGIIFIDHESSPDSWQVSDVGEEYLEQVRALIKPAFWPRWSPTALFHRVVVKCHKLQNPRYQEEGDIHIWEDDHIEWDKMESILKEVGFVDIKRTDYLLCRERASNAPLYHQYKGKYTDMSMLVARKGWKAINR